jgi:predicted nucleotidyltransferase
MAILALAKDFREFLRSLNSNRVEYLLIGGYAVGIHGHIRATNDLDIWVKISPENALRISEALRQFGFTAASPDPTLFLVPNKIIRMGVPPLRIELLTSISGVEFDSCYAERESIDIEGEQVPVISLGRLRENKAASGRPKDLADLESLPKGPSPPIG